MRRRTGGIWEIFMPGLGEGAAYKYHVRAQLMGYQQMKADPYGFAAEVPPKTASIVYDLEQYAWSDAEWLDRARKTDWLQAPVSIYEVHLESWMRGPAGRAAHVSRDGRQAGRLREADWATRISN